VLLVLNAAADRALVADFKAQWQIAGKQPQFAHSTTSVICMRTNSSRQRAPTATTQRDKSWAKLPGTETTTGNSAVQLLVLNLNFSINASTDADFASAHAEQNSQRELHTCMHAHMNTSATPAGQALCARIPTPSIAVSTQVRPRPLLCEFVTRRSHTRTVTAPHCHPPPHPPTHLQQQQQQANTTHSQQNGSNNTHHACCRLCKPHRATPPGAASPGQSKPNVSLAAPRDASDAAPNAPQRRLQTRTAHVKHFFCCSKASGAIDTPSGALQKTPTLAASWYFCQPTTGANSTRVI